MKLKRLDIYGFKSFPNKTKIDFDDGVTAIVGPNGSGKSNVADAVRWVLGEQSVKNLRGGKMEDVIFNGAQDRKPLGFAEVSLTIDNSEGAIKCDYCEITITRRIFRSGDSEYYINKTGCRLKDIVELFMDTGVGKEGYSIIGQGRIEQILSSKPDERRKIFDEAAGITKYKARRKEAERKLDRTVDNIDRVQDIISEIESRLLPLQKQSKNAKEYLEIKEQLKQYELNQFVRQYDKLREESKEIETNKQLMDEDIQNHQNLLTENEEALDRLLDESKGLAKKVEEESEHRFGIATKIEKIKGQMNVVQEKCEHNQQEQQRIKEASMASQFVITNKNKEIEQLLEEKELLDQELREKQAIIEGLEKEANQYKQLEEEHRNAVDQHRLGVIESLQKMNEARETVRKDKTILENATVRKQELKKQQNDCEENAQNLEQLIAQIAESLDKTKQEHQTKEEMRRKARKMMATGQASLDKLISKSQSLRSEINKMQSRRELIEEMMDNFEGYYKSVKEIMRETQQNNPMMEGVRGTVASLIQCEEKYETAIEMALGSAMQNIVIEEEEDAEKLIRYLKKNRAGRATFLPMYAVEERAFAYAERNSIIRMGGCIGVASELIDYDPQYKQVFKHLLGKIVIAKDMHSAIQIARANHRRFKIVTLSGEIINTGGAITGGSQGKHVAKLIGRERELESLNDQLEIKQQEYDQCKQERTTFVKQYEEAKGQIEELNREVQTLEVNIASSENNLKSIETTLEREDKKCEQLQEQQDEIDSEIEGCLLNIHQHEQQVKEYEEQEINKTQTADSDEQELKEIAELQQQNMQKIQDEQKIIDDKRQGIILIEQKIAVKRQEIETTKGYYSNGDSEISKRAEVLTVLYEEIEQYEQAIEALREEEKELVQSHEGINERLDRYNERIRETNQTIKDNTATLESMREQVHKMDVKRSRNDLMIENLTQNMSEDYEMTYAGALPYLNYSIPDDEIEEKTAQFKKAIQRLGNVNVNAIEEYREVKERYEFLTGQRDDLLSAKENLNSVIKDITGTMKQQFVQEFNQIKESFARVFTELFGGGKASLSLEDEKEPLECGIYIEAQPPGKRLQNMMLLSGGEKALTAIAILFGILEHRPTPFCILDEIEAALDDHNVDNFGEYLNKFSNKTQFVVITHRKGTMEASDAMYGIAMQEKGVSQLVSVRLEETA